MIISQTTIERQTKILRAFIRDEVTDDYVYLDVPAYLNIGDFLIAMGAFRLLDELPYKCRYKSTFANYNPSHVPDNCIILMQGGGNFGDLYPGANWYRNEIVKTFPNHKIIFLPQTITYKDTSLAKEDAEILSKHNNLLICARDSVSYAFLQRYFPQNRHCLLPDTALGLYQVLPQQNIIRNKALLMQRRDEERVEDWDVQGLVKDWDTILEDIHLNRIYWVARVLRKLQKAGCSVGGLVEFCSNWYLMNVITTVH